MSTKVTPRLLAAVPSVPQGTPSQETKKDTIQINISETVDSAGNKITGISALARKYNMDYDEFLKLNHIDQSQKWTYQAKADEHFYVVVDKPITEDKPKTENGKKSKAVPTALVGMSIPTGTIVAKHLIKGGKVKNLPLRNILSRRNGKATIILGVLGFCFGVGLDKMSNKSNTPKVTPEKTEDAIAKEDTTATPAIKRLSDYNFLTPALTEADKDVKITTKNGVTKTAEKLRAEAIDGAKRDEGFKDVKNPYIVRPYPYINENGKIEAATCIQKPTNENGPLKGKVVIINAGHGGYNPQSGAFDAGTVLSVKSAEGKNIPIEEWRVANDYTKELTRQLQEKGATVVVVSGAVRPHAMAEEAYLEHLLKGERSTKDVRDLMKNTKHSDMACIAIHVNASKDNPSAKICQIYGARGDKADADLVTSVQSKIKSKIAYLTPEKNESGYYVLNAMGDIPAAYIELGNIANADVAKSLLSPADRKKYTSGVAEGVESILLQQKQN